MAITDKIVTKERLQYFKSKLDANGYKNEIEKIKVNGNEQAIDETDKSVNIAMPVTYNGSYSGATTGFRFYGMTNNTSGSDAQTEIYGTSSNEDYIELTHRELEPISGGTVDLFERQIATTAYVDKKAPSYSATDDDFSISMYKDGTPHGQQTIISANDAEDRVLFTHQIVDGQGTTALQFTKDLATIDYVDNAAAAAEQLFFVVFSMDDFQDYDGRYYAILPDKYSKANLAAAVTAGKRIVAILKDYNGTAENDGEFIPMVYRGNNQYIGQLINLEYPQHKINFIEIDFKDVTITGQGTKWVAEMSLNEPASGDDNVIEIVKVNGTALTPDAQKAVDITVPSVVVSQDGKRIVAKNDSSDNMQFMFDAFLTEAGDAIGGFILAADPESGTQKTGIFVTMDAIEAYIQQSVQPWGIDLADDSINFMDNSKNAAVKMFKSAQQGNDILMYQFIDSSGSSPVTTSLALPTYVSMETRCGEMIDLALADISGVDFQIVANVSSLPATGTKGVFYLVPNTGSGQNVYDEYVWVNKGTTENPNYAYEMIGTTAVDLSGYVQEEDLVEITTAEIDAMFA